MNLREAIPEGETRVIPYQNSRTGQVVVALITHHDADGRKELMRALNTGQPIGPTMFAFDAIMFGARLIFAGFGAWIQFLLFQPKRLYLWTRQFRREL